MLRKLREVLRELRLVRKSIVNSRAAPKNVNANFRHYPAAVLRIAAQAQHGSLKDALATLPIWPFGGE